MGQGGDGRGGEVSPVGHSMHRVDGVLDRWGLCAGVGSFGSFRFAVANRYVGLSHKRSKLAGLFSCWRTLRYF